MINYRGNKRNRKKFRPVFNASSPPMFAQFVKPPFARPKARLAQVDRKNDSMFHVCFAVYDKGGHYSKFLGTTICSLFENTKLTSLNQPSITIHILHDNTLTEYNRDKLIQLVERYGQFLKFYNVEELCADKFAQIIEFFPNVNDDRHSIATFYRFFIQHLLPQDLEKVLYLDADIIVNFDFTEFWQIELGNKPFGAVPEFYQISDKEASIRRLKKYIPICGEGVVNPEDYFNAGVMMMNLKVLREEEETILAGMKFISEHPQFTFLDQDILNYCFSTSYLKLPTKFNRFVLFAKRENEWDIQEKLYHYASNRLCFVMDSRDAFNQLFMKYFIKTPWIDVDTKVALSGGIPSQKNYPVSVIIPMYNAEEYISECLDSLLAQTFQAFEVIVVDDCSIDNSVEIVESYAPKFNGRLKLAKTEVNSGGGGNIPRNIGLRIARGDYVYILDADDMILANALESFYSAAILYDAEVVYISSYYLLTAPNDISLYTDATSRKLRGIQTNFNIDDPKTNLSRLLLEGIREIFTDSWTDVIGQGNSQSAWTKFVQRDFLIKNKIFFPNIRNSGDFIWVINVYCHAKRFLRIATPLCLHRNYNENSITRKLRPPQEQCCYWFSTSIDFVKALCELQRENQILAENPIFVLATLRGKFAWQLTRTEEARKELGSEELFKLLNSEFSNTFDDSTAFLLPFLFSFMNDEIKTKEYYSGIFNKFNRYFTARIDIKFMSTEGDFQVVSISDNKADVRKPPFLQKDAIGYQIHSCNGNIELVVKATTDGKIRLSLKGLDVRDSKNKRMPYWIDYTNLTVNGQTIFNEIKSVWHDKSYNYTLDVKADEEITIKTEWLPHRSDDIKSPESIDQKFLSHKTSKVDLKLLPQGENDFKIIFDRLKPTRHDNACRYVINVKDSGEIAIQMEWIPNKSEDLSTVAKKIEPIVSKQFLPYLTSRLDVKFLPQGEGDFKIISVSDDKATVWKPAWFQNDGVGYQIQSCEGNLTLVSKATVDGQIQLNLKGMNVPDPEDNSKRVPYWIDYINLTINGQTIFDTLTPAWHDESYDYTLDVKADEEITIQTEWLPHSGEAPKPVELEKVEQVVDKFLPYLTSRVDVKLISQGEGDFKIISMSDKKADVWKPAWFQKGGVGYQVQSCEGNLTLVAKATADGQIQLNLKGMNVPDPEDNSKRLPYWIDYTNLTINGQTIFDTLTPAWHDESYDYAFDVKAGEEITIQTEWFPHSSEAPKPVEPEPEKVEPKVEPIVSKFLPYLTSRLDVKLLAKGEGDFKIISVSDDKATVWKPAWMQNDGIGYQIQSCEGNLTLVTKTTADGQIQLNLKGINIRDPENKSKRVPYWIDYTNLTINGQTIFDTLTPAWHDNPYNYTLDVKADEEITIQTEWLPHSSEAPKPIEPEKVEPIISKQFLPYLTSRLDIKLLPQSEGDFKIISMSDDKADIRKPAWLQKNGIGYQIQSYTGKMELVAKATADGQIQLNLKGMNVPDPENKSKRLPYWIDYTNLTINGQTIFDTLTPAWHDKSYNYTLDVKADEEITIQTEWLPHRSE